jgi:peptidoglycan/LPS O-acetylase OafA/YrhL
MVGWGVRVLVALGLLGSAWVHLVVWRDWARYDDEVGPMFLVNVGAGVVIAAAVLAWRGHWLPELAAVGFGVATLAAYALSLTSGFFGVEEQFRTDEEVWGVVTEAVCVAGGAALLALRYRRVGGRA